MCFIINIYSDDQQSILEYLKDTEINLNNILIITEDFNIRNNNWDLSYCYMPSLLIQKIHLHNNTAFLMFTLQAYLSCNMFI